MNLYDLSKFKISKDVVESFPDILNVLNRCQTELKDKQALKFQPINEIYQLIEVKKKYMEVLIKHYSSVKEDKGIIDE